jgi:peptidoglycan/LPS O-acetylase OafA/YrhL
LAVRPRFAILDGLRGIAALVVLAHHAFDPFDLSPLIPHSGLAVDLLFCLSGFVLSYAYEARLMSTMSLWDFVIIRVIRLYPLILLGTLLGFAFFTTKIVMTRLPFEPIYFVILLCELLLLPTPFPVGLDGWPGIAPFNIPAWSMFFLFIANFVYAAFIRQLTKTVLTVALIIGAVIVVAQSYAMNGVDGSWSELFGGFSRVFFPFFCGIFLFRRWKANPTVDRANYAPIMVLLLAAAFFCPVPIAFNWLFESLAVLLVFPIIITLGSREPPGARYTAFCLFVGRLAFPLYILHYPILRIFIRFEHVNALHGFKLGLVLTVEMLTAIGFSLVVMLFFDEPVRAWLTQKWRSLRPSDARSGYAK